MMRRDALVGLGSFAMMLPAQLGARASTGRDVRWVTLGTSGGPQVQPQRAQISNALVIGTDIYLFDVGNDVQRQIARAGLNEANVRAVFLSHHHLDHNADLGPVIVTHWLFGRGKLPIFGPEGTMDLTAGLAAANVPTALASFPTVGPAKPAIADTIIASDLPTELASPAMVYSDIRVRVTAIAVDHFQVPPSVPMQHLPKAVAYRVDAGGRSFVYSGDTGPSAGLLQLAQGADILITEVVDIDAIAHRIATSMPNAPAAIRDNVVQGMRVNHLTAENIGKLAEEARVGMVVLTHFVPAPEQMDHPRRLITAIRRHYKGRVVMARDLDSFS